MEHTLSRTIAAHVSGKSTMDSYIVSVILVAIVFASFIYHHSLVWLVALDVWHLLVVLTAAGLLWVCSSTWFLVSVWSFSGDGFSFEGLVLVIDSKSTYVRQWLDVVLW